MADGLTAPATDLELRPTRAGDREFLLAVYASTRAGELRLLPWTDAEKAAFVSMQFDAQDTAYRQAYPAGQFLVILRDGVPVGRIYRARLDDEIRIIDIALLPEHRSGGIGSRLLADVIADADAARLAVRLHVEPRNPAIRLYERLGFRPVGEPGFSRLMERAPRNSS